MPKKNLELCMDQGASHYYQAAAFSEKNGVGQHRIAWHGALRCCYIQWGRLDLSGFKLG